MLSEFGRTPQINGRGGRDHYPAAWTNFLCGGNIRGGQVIGSTDKIGSRPTDTPDRAAAGAGVDLPRHGHQPRHHHDARPGRPARPPDRRRADPPAFRVKQGYCVPTTSRLMLFLPMAAVLGAEPAIRDLSPRGLQAGGVTTVVVDGADFSKAPRLVLPFPARQQLKAGSTGNRAIFEVTLDRQVQAGYHNLRMATDAGVSLPVAVAVDVLPQLAIGATIDRFPLALHGAVNGGAVVEARFNGKSGHKVLINVEAHGSAASCGQ